MQRADVSEWTWHWIWNRHWGWYDSSEWEHIQENGRGALHRTRIRLHTYTGCMHKSGTRGKQRGWQCLWLEGNAIKLDWGTIFTPHKELPQELEPLLTQHAEVLKSDPGTLGAIAKIYVDSEAKPRYFKARHLPYVLKDEFDRADPIGEGRHCRACEFFRPAVCILPMLKPDQTARICGDSKVTVNNFTKPHNRLPYGMSSAPSIFQHTPWTIYYSTRTSSSGRESGCHPSDWDFNSTCMANTALL